MKEFRLTDRKNGKNKYAELRDALELVKGLHDRVIDY